MNTNNLGNKAIGENMNTKKKNAISKKGTFITPQKLLEGIILSEILGEPKARKGLTGYNGNKGTNSK